MELLKGEEPLLVSGELDIGEESCKMLASGVELLSEVQQNQARRVHIRLNTPGLNEMQMRQLKSIVQRYRGECEVKLHLQIPQCSETTIGLPDSLKMAASDDAMEDAKALFGYNVMNFE
jgi:DNA polymerase-3 subunit alpha